MPGLTAIPGSSKAKKNAALRPRSKYLRLNPDEEDRGDR
jgi:hypothetical protein